MKSIYKTIYQYNKVPVSAADMERLQEIARDCQEVKNYVHTRYSGIHSLSKIYPGYTVQNEMTKSGLRERLGLPSVYFYLSVFDALANIKSQWAYIKGQVEKNIRNNSNLTPEDRHYLRFVMKQSQCFASISSECSCCGAQGLREGDLFRCTACQAELPERLNTARNVLKRGQKSS